MCMICIIVSRDWEVEFLVTLEASLVDMESIKEFYIAQLKFNDTVAILYYGS